MGDDYSGPVTVAADDGSERVLANIDVWSQSETIMEMVKGALQEDRTPSHFVLSAHVRRVPPPRRYRPRRHHSVGIGGPK